jgi:hypothetical protein
MGARLYVPHLGRFLQTDPIRGGSANAYEYGFGDCVNNTDLDGMSVVRDAESPLPSCKNLVIPGPNVSVHTQIHPKSGDLTWGVVPGKHLGPTSKHIQVFINGKRFDRQRRARFSHGTIPSKFLSSGDEVRIQGHVRSLATRRSYWGQRSCVVP